MIPSEFFVGQQVAFRPHAMDGTGAGFYGEVTQIQGRMARIVVTNFPGDKGEDVHYVWANMDEDGHYFDVKGQEKGAADV